MSITSLRHRIKAHLWKRLGAVPGSSGSSAAKWLAIEKAVSARGGGDYGANDPGIDERVVEYPWIFDRMAAVDRTGGRVLDAGSILNHARVLEWWRQQGRSPVSIVTLAHEGRAFVSDRVRYEFADLRQLPYRDEWFTAVICASTLEHVGLDNSIYGAEKERAREPRAEAVRAMRELRRVCVAGGTLLLSVPFGARSIRAWMRVFDADDVDDVVSRSGWTHVRSRYFRVTPKGWHEVKQEEAATAGYNEPRDREGQRTAADFAAAAEAVALIELTRP